MPNKLELLYSVRGKTSIALGISVLALMAATPVPAAHAADATATGGGVEDIVVTARRRVEQMQTQPLSITAMTGATLERMNVRSLIDLTSIPNVSFTFQPGFVNTYTPAIRGISQSDPILTLDQPVALYVDGVLIPRAVGALMEIVDPQRIEVLKGPQGSLFGRNTTAGAISITLPNAADEFNASVKAGYASNNELTLRGIINTGVLGSSGVKAMLAVQHHDMDGYVRNLETSNAKYWPGSDQTDSVLFKLDGDVGDKVTFGYMFDYTHTLADVLNGQTIYASPDTLSYYGNSPNLGGQPYLVSLNRLSALYDAPAGPLSKQYIMGNALTLNFNISDAFNIKSITAQRNFKSKDGSQTVGQGNLLGETFGGVAPVSPYAILQGTFPGEGDSGHIYHQHQFSQEFQFSGEIGRHKYVGGVYYFNERVGEKDEAFLTLIDIGFGSAVGVNNPSGLDYAGHNESYAAYASDSWTPPILDDKLEITGGVRYTIDRRWIEYLNDLPDIHTLGTASHYRKDGAPSGDATAKYQWTQDIMTYLRFANSYGSGGYSGRDDPSAPGFAPEYVNSFETGIKSEFMDRKVRLNADVFYTKYTDQQITTFAPGLNANGFNSSHVTNAGSSKYIGSEVELTLVPVQGWQVDLSWGHTWPHYNQFLYQPVVNGPVLNIAGSAKFTYFSKTSYSIGSGYTFGDTGVGELSVHAQFDYKSGMYFHPSDQFNALNELIKGGPQNILSGEVTLAHIPVQLGRTDVSLAVYGKNLLNKAYRVQAVDFEIVPPNYNFASGWFARPRVIGVTLNAKY